MTQKHNRFFLNRYTVSVLILTVIAAASVVVVTQHKHTDAAASVKPGIGAAVPSQFSFSGASSWWQGATSKSDIALFDEGDGCFVSIQHKTGTIAAGEAKMQETDASLTNEGYTITPGATQTLAVRTPAGPRSYELKQSSVISPAGSDNKIKGGQEFGYLQLSQGYLFVEGYCDIPAKLPTTIPALQAVKFDETK